jgi:hypothetical protein
MLTEVEALIQSLAGVGDDIAHDLRTPLAREKIRDCLFQDALNLAR